MRSLRLFSIFPLICSLTIAADLQSLMSTADVAIIGTLSPKGSNSGNLVFLTVTPERVLKGTASAGVPLDVQWESHPLSGPGPATSASFELPTSYRGIWFFKRSDAGVLNPMPVRLGQKASLYDLFYQLSKEKMAQSFAPLAGGSDTIMDLLAVEVANASSAGADGGFPGEVGFATYSMDSPVIKEAFRLLAASPDSKTKAEGLAGLVARGDVDGLLALEQQAGAIKASDLKIVLLGLRDSFRNPDPTAIACLGRIAHETGGYRDELGDAAMNALGAIHTKDTLAVLVAELDSARQERRRSAVLGLAFFANGMSSQSPATMASLSHMRGAANAPFRTEATMSNFSVPAAAGAEAESAVLTFWKNWWKDNAAKLGF